MASRSRKHPAILGFFLLLHCAISAEANPPLKRGGTKSLASARPFGTKVLVADGKLFDVTWMPGG